jgi:hypothetical protein
MKREWKGPRDVQYETYKPNDRQRIFHAVPRWRGFNKLVKGAIGGIGGGKSAACQQEQAFIATQTPGGVSVACRVSMPKADISLIDEYSAFLGKSAEWVPSKTSFFFPNDHRLIVCPLDRWDRFGSTQFVTAYSQETQEADYRSWYVLSERLRHPAGMQNGVPYYRLLFDSRPVESKHWINEEFIQKAWNLEEGVNARLKAPKPYYVYCRFESWDNQANLRPGYIEELIQEHKGEPQWEKMMIRGEIGYTLEGRAVYGDVYREELHVATIEEDTRLPILRGWDFGYHSPAIVWCQYTRDGTLVVLRELCPKEINLDRLIQEMLALQENEFPRRHPSQYRDFGDIAGQQVEEQTGLTAIEVVENRLGTHFEGLRKDNVEAGLEVIRRLMRQPAKAIDGRLRTRFLADRRCPTLLEAMKGMYHYPEKGAGMNRPKKGTGYDDVCDALRYLAQTITAEGVDDEYEWTGGGTTSFASY